MVTDLELAEPRYVIPVDIHSGHVLVSARINGQPATLILDTGSSNTSLDREWAARLQLPTVGNPIRMQGTGAATVSLARVASLGLGKLELENQVVALIPM